MVLKDERLSLNRAVAELLAKATRAERPESRRLHSDLDHLAGAWSAEEAEEFDAYLAESRAPRSQDWK